MVSRISVGKDDSDVVLLGCDGIAGRLRICPDESDSTRNSWVSHLGWKVEKFEHRDSGHDERV